MEYLYRQWLVQGFHFGTSFAMVSGALCTTRAMIKAEHVDDLYRSRDRQYMFTAKAIIGSLRKFDVIIFSTYNPLHPELILEDLHDKIKVLGFSDDPHFNIRARYSLSVGI